jgi:uncharacterized protein YkuJ
MKKLAVAISLAATHACWCEDPFLERTPAPEIEVTDDQGRVAGNPPLVIAFGEAEIGARVARNVRVKNKGNAPLSIHRLGPLVDATDPVCPHPSAEFAYPPVGASQRVEVDREGERVVEVAYRPQDGGADCAIMEIKSDDEDEPSVRVYFVGQGSAAKFCATESEIDLGDVVIGQEATRTTQVGNCGLRPLTLQSVATNTSFPPFDLRTTITTPRTLNPGDTIDVDLAFAPTQPGRWGGVGATRDPGVILFTTTDAGMGSLTLRGRGITPPACRMSLAPTAINFGLVAVGSTAQAEVLLANAGDAPCTVDTITRVDGAADFAVTAGGAPPAITVAAAQTATFTITFSPTLTGLQRATFRVHSNSLEPGTENLDVLVEANQPPPPGCHLQANPAFVNFGLVPTGSTTSTSAELRNVGDDMCRVTAVDFPLGAAEFSTSTSILPGFGSMVPDGDSMSLSLNFRATTPGPRTGRARVKYKAMGLGEPEQTLFIDLAANAQAPAICVTPDTVDMGSVPVAGEARQSLSIQSCGAAPLNVRGIHFASGSSAAFDTPAAPGLPVVLEPGTSVNLEIRYRPTSAGGDLAILVINSDDPGIPSARVRVLGNAEGLCPPLMRCEPGTLSFGDVEVGIPQTRTIVCRNFWTQTITVTSVTVQSTPPWTAVTQVPVTLSTGEGVTIQVTASPTQVGAMTGRVLIASNACEPTQQVQLEATAVPPTIPDCTPPNSFNPRTEWTWTQSSNHPQKDQVWITPVVINLTDDNGDGVVSAQDVPDILFTTFDGRDFNTNPQDTDNFNRPMAAALRAVSGDDGRELWTVMPEALFLQSQAGIAAGDIDGDNLPEIVGSKWVVLEGEADIPNGPKVRGRFVRGRLLCFGADGSFRWESDEWVGKKEDLEDGGAPLIADLDQDGFGEVIYRNHVFDHEGHLLWAGTKGAGNAYHGALPTAADLDRDGRLEVVAGNTAYRADGSILWNRDDVADGPAAVVDFENDGFPEVVVSNGRLHILKGADGSNAYPPINLPYPDPSCAGGSSEPECETPIPGAPAMADFDADGKPEIAMANRDWLLVYEANGQENWRVTISDQSGMSGPSAFDFEGDGIYEVVYADEGNVFALRGTTGQSIYRADRASRTIFEYAVIADTNNDGHANIVIAMNEPLLRSAKGIKVLSNADGSWVSAGRVWNQHAFHITNVAEGGTIPRQERPNYQGGTATNTFRAQTPRCR